MPFIVGPGTNYIKIKKKDMDIMKRNNCYKYPKTQRESVNGKRHYVFNEEKLPSVTTILDATQSEEKRESWMSLPLEVQLCTKY